MRINQIICSSVFAVFIIMTTGIAIADENIVDRSNLGINTHWYRWLEPDNPNGFTAYKEKVQDFGFVRDGAWWGPKDPNDIETRGKCLEPEDLVGPDQWENAGWGYDFKQTTLCGNEISYQSGYDNLVKQFQDPGSPQLLLLLEQEHNNFSEGGDSTQYYDYVFNVVERYDKDGIADMDGLQRPVTYFEVGNEVNYYEDGNLHGYLSPEDYVKNRLIPAYRAAEDANPDAIIMCGGIATESDLSGNDVHYFNTNYLEAVYDNITKNGGEEKDFYMDKVAIHYYSNYDKPELFEENIEKVRQVGKVIGDKPIWITEFAPDPSNPELYARFLTLMYTNNIEMPIIYNLKNDGENEYGLYSYSCVDGKEVITPKASVKVIDTFFNVLDGTKAYPGKEKASIQDGTLYKRVFKNDEKTVTILWYVNDADKTKEISYDIELLNPALILDVYGSTIPIPTSSSISVGAKPLYIVETALPINVQIISPSQSSPVSAGNYESPIHIGVTAEVKSGDTPIPDLTSDNFRIKIGDIESTATVTDSPIAGKYVFDVTPPQQYSPGKYDLEISVNNQGETKSDKELEAVIYGEDNANANVMLVIDRSGSMYGSPISSAKNAANLFIDYMEPEDKAGIVSFSTSARYDYHLVTLTPEVKNNIKLKINSISASGNTAIGSGLRYGLNDLLDYGDPDIPWAIVLLSDGYQNNGENPSSVVPLIQANNIQVYTVGLGSSVDEGLLKDIASQTGGKYYNSPAESQLQEIYNEIVGKIIGWDTVVIRKIMMFINDVISIPVEIDSAIEKASFGISWPGSNVDLILYKPDGSMVDPSVADSDPNIEYLNGSTYKIYKVTNPEPGEWIMELTATDMPVGGEDVYVTVRAKSTLSMLLSTDKDQYNQGESVKIVADLSGSGTQIKEADVGANITLPDLSIEHMILYDDGSHGDGEAQDGVYANFFMNTLLQGDYRIDVTSTGSLSDGSQFNRIEDTSFEIIPGSSIIVEAGIDQRVEEGASVNFKGSFTASGSHTYSYHWDFGDGSEEDSSLTTSHMYADDGAYTVNLTVADEEGNFGNDTLLVTVNNALPIVNAGSDLEITAGGSVSFTGIFSDLGWFDTHTAEWSFGEGTVRSGVVYEEYEYPNSTGTVSGSFSCFDAGEYIVTLNVTDDDGGIGQDQLTVTVRPIKAEVTFDPKTLNLNSSGQWVTAYIELPANYNVSGINISSVLLNGTAYAVSGPKYGFVTDERGYLTDIDHDGISERMFKFNRGDVARILKVGDKVTVTFTGKVEYDNGVSSGMASFEGSDIIRVTESKNKKG